MRISLSTIPLPELDVDLLIYPIVQEALDEALVFLGEHLTAPPERIRDEFKGELAQTLLLYPEGLSAARLVLLGLGPSEELTGERLRRAMAPAANIVMDKRTDTVAIVVPTLSVDAETTGQAIVEGFMLSAYRFNKYKTEQDTSFQGPGRLVLHVEGKQQPVRRGAERGRVIAEATNFARDLVNLSPHEKSAQDLARYAQQSAKKYGYYAEVWDKERIAKEGMGGLLAVNRGSVDPPTFTILEWQPENAVNRDPVVLVGKGVVFDTGGLDLKPPQYMEKMKTDMAGAAAVIGTMEAVARLKLPVHVVALIPATDNRPGEKAYVPGEVVQMHSGATVEVLNTDAEGRLILADALSYAKTYDPQLVIDLATLTGAQVIALGRLAAAFMTNNHGDARARTETFIALGEETGDRVAPLPMYEEYKELLKSDIADLKNIGNREAGSITAAKFLEHFTSYPWVHLDIAGPSYLDQPFHYRPKGATGFGVRLLVEYLRTLK